MGDIPARFYLVVKAGYEPDKGTREKGYISKQETRTETGTKSGDVLRMRWAPVIILLEI
jgi:hypothetical protein